MGTLRWGVVGLDVIAKGICVMWFTEFWGHAVLDLDVTYTEEC